MSDNGTMPKRSSKKPVNLESPGESTQSETTLVETKSTEKNPAAVALGRLGGLKGGKARAEKLTPEQRKEIAEKAAKARWNGK